MAWRWNAPVKYPKQEKKNTVNYRELTHDISLTVLIGT